MRKTREVPPAASALVSSLRGVGYSLNTALADLIDNSIAAGADRIDIRWSVTGDESTATILDNGCGMDEETLVHAMRFGGSGPHTARDPADLGRFGLGLKTASLSQCRCLTVASKSAAGTAVFTWDIDEMLRRGDGWHLIEGGDRMPEDVQAALDGQTSGTVVVWRRIDFGRTSDAPNAAALARDIGRASHHLGMVFHRFISGDAQRLSIALNGRLVRAWDPFVTAHPSTTRLPEQIFNAHGGIVAVQGFVLPHRDRFKNEGEFEQAGGPEGWNAQQGFYIYRQKRLLSSGGWLGLGGSRAWTREEPSRLARIRVDIPNTADADWRIDIRKAIARPPDAIRLQLQRIADDVRQRAREVFVFRGKHGSRTRRTSESVERIWQVHPEGAKRRYTLKRDHGLADLVRSRLAERERPVLEALLDLIERTVPIERVWLDCTENGPPGHEETPDELLDAASSLIRTLERTGISFEDAAARVARMEPYDQIDDLEEKARRGA